MDKELFDFQRNAIMGNIADQPLCADYKNLWRMCGNDKEKLIRLALQQQSLPFLSHACYKKLGLSKEYILENFGEYINGNKVFDDVEDVKGYKYDMYVDFKGNLKAVADVTCMMWCDNPLVEISATKCPIFYVSNGSEVHYVLEGFNSIRIYLFDESKVVIDDADETCDVVVYQYSNRATVEMGKYCLGKVKIFIKQLKL